MPQQLDPRLLESRDAIAALCRAHAVTALEVFGSAAQGRFDPIRSDYDFIARFRPQAAPSLARRYVAFSEALETLFGRPVDLMTDHPIDNPYLRAAVESSRYLLYAESAAQTPA